MTVCGARTRAGTDCQRPAGWGTDHAGEGKCKLHGGATPIRTGRYSKVMRPRIRELLEELDDDPNPLDLLPELKLLRALTGDFINRHEEFTEALLKWSAEGGSPPKRLLDIADAARLLESISRIVDRIQKHRYSGAISLSEMQRFMTQLGLVVQRYVKDQAVLEAIDAGWKDLSVDLISPSGAEG